MRACVRVFMRMCARARVYVAQCGPFLSHSSVLEAVVMMVVVW